MANKKRTDNALNNLLESAGPEILRDLVSTLAFRDPEGRRECFEYLKSNAPLSTTQKQTSDGEVVLALWEELYPDLEEMDDCGGGDYHVVDHVGDLLGQIREKLADGNVSHEVRRELLEEILPFIKSGNAGFDDELYDTAYTACREEAEWRWLACSFEAIRKDWPLDHARRIYRRLGDREKYLELRRMKMVYGLDYHDLAQFYQEEGNREQALAVAEEGLKKGQGRMYELRRFLAEHAQESGNRERYLDLQFAQAIDSLNLESYKTFEKICDPSEWKRFEAGILGRLESAWSQEKLKILMYRREYEQAVAVLTKGRHPLQAWNGSEELEAARQLERFFPEEILLYYISGLGNLNVNATRKEYARKAKVMAKIRHVYLDILKSEVRWRDFAGKIKRENLRRPALQEEFARAMPGWGALF
jgi:tetratricopeptide (TPR) repeat protein